MSDDLISTFAWTSESCVACSVVSPPPHPASLTLASRFRLISQSSGVSSVRIAHTVGGAVYQADANREDTETSNFVEFASISARIDEAVGGVV